VNTAYFYLNVLVQKLTRSTGFECSKEPCGNNKSEYTLE